MCAFRLMKCLLTRFRPGPIEKGANDGQISYANSLTAALRAAISAKTTKTTRGTKGKKRSRTQTTEESAPTSSGASGAADAAVQPKANWGLFEPVRGLLGPVADLLNTQVFMTILIALVLYFYFFRAPPYTHASSQLSLSTPQRLAAYEQIWRTEENELWNWLEDRVAFDQSAGLLAKEREQAVLRRQRLKREMGDKLDEGAKRMSEREMDEAIRVTEERLEGLKRAVLERRGDGAARNEGDGAV